MMNVHEDLIKEAYAAFNDRNIEKVLSMFDPEVHWSNGWEGGYVNGHEEVRTYWTRQWKEIDPHVDPTGFKERPDGRLEVEVHQLAKDMQGNILFNGIVKHLYTFKEGLIQTMDIEK